MKTVVEWSTEFDLLYNNISSNQAPGLNEYEKSVFLTRAQEFIVTALYKGTLGEPFESTESATVYLANLVVTDDTIVLTKSTSGNIGTEDVYVAQMPEDMMFRVYEECTIRSNNKDVKAIVVPVTRDEFWRTSRNPFKRSNIRRVIRLTSYDDTGEKQTSELFSKYPITKYIVSYIKQPNPIILEELPSGLTINNESSVQTCNLHEALHTLILNKAVELAQAAWAA